MKKFAFILSAALLLGGCSQNTKEKADAESKPAQTEKTETESLTPKANNSYQPNPQVTDDRTLTKIGQTYRDDKGQATLKAIKQINKTYKQGPVELTIKDIKLIHLRPDYGMIDYFHVLTHREEFDFVKISAKIKNTSSKPVNYAPVALLKTNTDKTFDWEKDIYLERLEGKLPGNSDKSGNLGFIVNPEENESADNVKWIEITTSDVFNQSKQKINDSKKIKLSF
ncbi:hypothetical protein SAMN04488137_2935 [Fictibacillus solisalsi]|uniref:DUF4352 domain-containing protein n=1 Tax=Fictibacillus solisalsi TaxID=459525 RepID=A0A1G9XRF1_9BACL|nr:hypothetical protein [Fictibacillus solisalsi]SDM98823.1 hypothetical protein SAMN04488137_2935 [Fictibacillus solisalsi]